MPGRDPHPSDGEQPRSLRRDRGSRTRRGLFCSLSEEAWGLPLWPGASGHLFRGHLGQRAAGGQLSPRPTTLAASLCLPSPPSPTLSIPEEWPLPGTPRGGTASSGPPPPQPGGDPKECRPQPGRAAGPRLELLTRVLACPLTHQTPPASDFLLASAWPGSGFLGLHPRPAPACDDSELCSRALWTQSARPAHSVLGPSWTLGLRNVTRDTRPTRSLPAQS